LYVSKFFTTINISILSSKASKLSVMTNRAIAFSEAGPASVLKETSIPLASPTGWDILVKNLAVSVNLLDVKARTQGKDWPELTWSDHFRVLGYDGADIVEEVGPKAEDLFKKGDHVWYSGTVSRDGSNSE
jgi:NADPH:quinone reductase-like Zn-dependent oxidoreductase